MRVPPEFERQYHRFLEGRGDAVGSLVLCLTGNGIVERDSGAWAALVLSRIYIVKGSLSLAISYLRLSCDLFLAGESKKIPLGIWINRAIILKLRGKYRATTGLLRRIFRLSLKYGDTFLAAKSALNLALVLARTGDFKEANLYLEYSSLNYSILGCDEGILRAELARAFIESRSGIRPGALDRLQDQLSDIGDGASIRERILCRLLISEILLAEGEYRKARLFLEDIDGDLLGRFRPLRIRWLILKAGLERALGMPFKADCLDKIVESETGISGLFDPEAEHDRGFPGGGIMIQEEVGDSGFSISGESASSTALETVPYCGPKGVAAGRDLFSATEFITNDIAMKLILEEVERLSRFPFPILLSGESGTGKEVIARLIHQWSDRGDFPFIPVNTAAVPADLFEAQLFGYKKGSFTGASADRSGIIEAAGRGTIFLDEIGELTMQLQAKLLRLLENGEFIRIGDPIVRRNAARVVAATNRDLCALADGGQVRNDFYYRLSAFTVRLPPLRERGSDLAVLCDHFLEDISGRFGLGPFCVGSPLRNLLSSYSWPGNVRELKNELTYAAIRRKYGVLRVCDMSTRLISRIAESVRSDEVRSCGGEHPAGTDIFGMDPHTPETLERRMRSFERKELYSALSAAGGNKTKAATMLGLKRTTFIYRLKRLGLNCE